MYKREAELVTEDVLADPMNMNIRLGGKGGWDYVNSVNTLNQRLRGERGNITQKILRETDKEWVDRIRVKRSNTMKECYKDGRKTITYSLSFGGKTHSEEAKQKIGVANAISQSGSGNSQYGTCWIHSIESQECKKIKQDDLELFIEQGWIKGRKMKF